MKEIGSKYMLNCGVEVEIVSLKPFVVQYEQGNTKSTTYAQLKAGNVGWKKFGHPTQQRGSEPFKLWDYKELACGVTVQLVEYLGCDKIKVEDEYGNSKWSAMSQLRKGSISWREFGFRSPSRIDSNFFVGQRLSSKRHGRFKILQINSCRDIIIQWDDYEGLQSTDSTRLRSCTVKPDLDHWNYLGVDINKFYVYLVIHDKEIIYIGKGKDNRYLHVTSGRSHNYFLNKLHFEGKFLKVIIYGEYVTNSEAVLEEKRLIKEYYPIYNTADKPKEHIASQWK